MDFAEPCHICGCLNHHRKLLQLAGYGILESKVPKVDALRVLSIGDSDTYDPVPGAA